MTCVVIFVSATTDVSSDVKIACVLDSQCGHGSCDRDGQTSEFYCQCDDGWISSDDKSVCDYEQKTELIAFLVSFFVGSLGVDWFYLARGDAGYIIAGVIKLLLCICGPTVSGKIKSKHVFGCTCSIIGIWWLIDWIRILCGAFPDGNGYPLYMNM